MYYTEICSEYYEREQKLTISSFNVGCKNFSVILSCLHSFMYKLNKHILMHARAHTYTRIHTHTSYVNKRVHTYMRMRARAHSVRKAYN